MAIRCCHGCVAPKRHPGCHGTCPEYMSEKAKHDADMAKDYQYRKTQHELNEQRYRAITKVTKHKRKLKEE